MNKIPQWILTETICILLIFGIIYFQNSKSIIYAEDITEEANTTIEKIGPCIFNVIMEPDQLPVQIVSPNFPHEYPPNSNCKWIISSPFGFQLRMVFETFHLQYAQFCSPDYLQITDLLGSNLYCGIKSPPNGIYRSIGSKIELQFVTDGTWQFKGFSLKIEVLKVYCGGNFLNSAEGTITSPGYPNKYPNDILCIWTFESTEGHVEIECMKPFLIETSLLCRHDSLIINTNGDDEMQASLRYCGTNNPGIIKSKQNKMHIFFRSDYLNNYPGFRCEYRMNISQEDEMDESLMFGTAETTCECGRTQDPRFRVYGGKRTKHKSPLVALVYNDGAVFCGGTMITPTFVLTAAHCLHRETTNSFKVVIQGYEDPQMDTKNFLTVKQIIIHEKYGKKDYDIALIKIPNYYGRMDRSFIACLPSETTQLEVKTKGEVYGWGENYLENDDRLYHSVVPIIDDSACIEHFNSFSLRQFCVGTNISNVGRGDSGGPFFLTLHGRLTIVGLVSYGKRYNARNYPAVFTKVSEMLDWVLDNAKSACRINI